MKGNATGTLLIIGIGAAFAYSAFGPAGVIVIGLLLLLMSK